MNISLTDGQLVTGLTTTPTRLLPSYTSSSVGFTLKAHSTNPSLLLVGMYAKGTTAPTSLVPGELACVKELAAGGDWEADNRFNLASHDFYVAMYSGTGGCNAYPVTN